MKETKKNWTIGICCSESDGVDTFRVRGTKTQVKKYLVNCVKSDKENDEDKFDMGTLNVKDIDEDKYTSELSAYATYSDYHIDYTARPEDDPYELDAKGNIIEKEEV